MTLGKLTFTKTKVQITQLTQDAVLCSVRVDTGLNIWATGVWIPRSNLRSDDDKRCEEFKARLTVEGRINTFFHVADWYVASKGWKPKEKADG